MLSPPRELGNEAFNQAQSERGLPARSDRASLMDTSKVAVTCLMRSGGHVLNEKDTLGNARHERRRIVSIWESPRSGNFARDSFTFLSFVKECLHKKWRGQWDSPEG